MIGNTATTFNIDPLVPLWALAVCLAAHLVLSALLLRKGKKHLWLRFIMVLGLFLVLLNPITLTQNRVFNKNVVLVFMDETFSQSVPPRTSQTSMVYNFLKDEFDGSDRITAKFVPVRHTQDISDKGDAFQETLLINAVTKAIQNIDKAQLAGVILVTDGQVHDAPILKKTAIGTREEDFYQNALKDIGLPEGLPIHVLLTGREEETDKQIIVEETPFYGIIGQEAQITLRADVTGKKRYNNLPLTLKINGKIADTQIITPNENITFTVPVEAAGHNIYEFEIPHDKSELTDRNNRKIIKINGVRDRLQVLLVSGKPNPGGRMWRDILSGDASVDLVHFTILREPGKIDSTPEDEMSLIEFPIRELFETKIKNFDLIILDRYGLTYLLPTRYFDNMHDFVAEGGALLVATGPEAVSDMSIFDTSLRPLFPGLPTGDVFDKAFVPALSSQGRKHPVTSFMSAQNKQQTRNAPSAPWFRQVEVTPTENAQTLLEGADKSPLLLLKRYEKGRVSLMTSDQLWLWARGFQTAGPDKELLKRVIHWLMKEPDLEENGLKIDVNGHSITLRKHSMTGERASLVMRRPSGEEETLILSLNGGSGATATIDAEEPGIYSFKDKQQEYYAVVGDLNTPEQQDLISTTEKLSPLIKTSGGAINRVETGRFPDIRLRKNTSKAMHGEGWIGLKDRQSYSITGAKQSPTIPRIPAFIILFIGFILAWVLEGGRTKRAQKAS